MRKAFLIAGLGNPGGRYERTRHNIGFQVVDQIANDEGLVLKKKLLLRGRLAHGLIAGCDVFLLQPLSFMNLSGTIVAKVMRKYSIPLENLLVIVDDVALPFGQLRIRGQGSSGGHNGLKNVEENLKSMSYSRLRVGVGDNREGDLAEYVLSPFTPEESKLVPKILERAAMIVMIWLTEGLTSAMNKIHPNQKE
jgi:peptidyl-tRNA hydrolase, PTH1 family